ncbi:OprO/OprP family phosphate-selective porin [Novosphingobium album (ex Liu et al. 2023)]|uniref:Porin n=1 Tax=Novosphingobium album (ex Liu et al. 2023) TaxID=3031130 RepID=A0ABT5WN87_9SPHN|nr:porin [Novosphingobium album (ex Liu et al. 2023)]MDE8651516.1 porin [Novosphingobium album (ex Liu et al. 2023)]
MVGKRFALGVPACVAAATICAAPAVAQAVSPPAPASPATAASPDPAPAGTALQDEVVRLRAEVEALKAEMRSLRGEMAAAGQPAAPVPAAPASEAQVARAAPPAKPADAGKPAPGVLAATAWKGAPEFRSDNGWSFKPRGRLQIDGGYLAAPASRFSGQADGRGVTTRVRRAYLGAQGTIPGGFSYRAEVDLGTNAVSWVDLLLAYDKGPFNVTIGQQNAFTSLEQMQSDLFLTFNERASFITAFNLERRVGVSMGYRGKSFMANAGVFTDDLSSLTNDGDKSVSYDGRVVWMPRLGAAQLHLGGSAHYRRLGDFQATLGSRYRARPYIATTDIRYVDTGILTVEDETQYGLEFALNRKRLHLAGEAAWLRVGRPADRSPTFFGGYFEAGLFLTPDSRGYRNGTFDRTVPTHPLSAGGIGAIEVNLRYDRLDLTDAGIGGGTQDGFGSAIVWTPVDNVRFMANYMHLLYDIPNAQPRFDADVVGLRSQLDF